MPPITLTPELINHWRFAVRGNANPEIQTNPVWQWLVKNPMSAYRAGQEFGDGRDSGRPGWSFERYGQSETPLPDGRTVHIAGEHEDHYDPDFFIYNDVVVTHPDGSIEIFGYSIDVFPPTDFHSATLAGDRIVLIGSLGYPPDRKAGVTQVIVLECETWRASIIDTYGASPGWIHGHESRLGEDGQSIIVSGGKVDRCDDEMLIDNIDEWRLDLATWRWEQMTARRWPRFEVHRVDRKLLHLWQMRQALWSKKVGWDDYEPAVQRLSEELGGPPRLDIVAELYRPPVPHDVLPEDENDHRLHRIRIGDVVVRYVEDSFTIQATIEGELSGDVVNQLRDDLHAKLEALEQAKVTIRSIESV